jgi:hypothetical protein
VTICIVARSTEKDGSFVVAGDRLFPYGGAYLYDSISLKRLPISYDRRWHCMFAGPIACVMPLVRLVRKDLGMRRPPYRYEQIERAWMKAFQDYREQLVNDRVLSVYKTDLVGYQQKALKFGAKELARINRRIERVKLGVDFIVYGYDDLNESHIFTLHETSMQPYVVESADLDQEGWAVIGCGSKYARASLLSSGLLPIHSQVEMLCRVCEAKIEAEKDHEVGKDSAAGVSNRPTSAVGPTTEAFIGIPAAQAIRKAHAQHKDRPYPKELLTALSDCIDSNVTTERMHETVWRAEQMIIAENQQRRGGHG